MKIEIKTNILLVAWLALAGIPGFGQGFLLRQDLDAIPGQVSPDITEGIELVVGRLPERQAVQLKDRSLTWELTAREPYNIEFWVKPVGWDGASDEKVVLAVFRTEGGLLSLYKAAEAEVLVLAMDGVPLGRYPVYDWKDHSWRKGQERSLWYYIHIRVDNDQAVLNVDGFPAEVSDASAHGLGALQEVTLHGGRGTAFSELLVSQGVMDAAALRSRYRSLYRGGPVLEPVTITVPWVDKAPTLAGTVPEKEYAEMATLTGFNQNTGDVAGRFEGSGIQGYIGYDNEALYLALNTPYQGGLNATHWDRWDMNLWDEESYEFFLCPPWSEVPEYWLLVGNPHGDQADLKGTDLSWNANWQWNAAISEGVWSGEMRVPFAELGVSTPEDSEVWTMNLFNSRRRAAWSPARAYHDVRAFGVLRFDRNAPVIRAGAFLPVEDGLAIPFQITGRGPARTFTLGYEVYGGGDTLPRHSKSLTFELADGQAEEVLLDIAFDGLGEGILVVYIREGETTLFYRSGVFPLASHPVKSAAVVESASDDEQEYARQWTVEEMGEEVLGMHRWAGGQAGRSDKVMSPWTPMEVDGGTIACWGREYTYQDTLFPASITSLGEELLAGAPYFRLKTPSGTHIIKEGDVVITPVNDRTVEVRTRSVAGGLRFLVDTEYAFDGLAKVSLVINSEGEAVPVDSLEWVIPLQGDRIRLFHYFASYSAIPPGTASGAVPEGGIKLDRFRELIWLGAEGSGFTWFAENMKHWRLQDEDGIQRLEPLANGDYELVVTLANKPSIVDGEWHMVFGLQATPTRARHPALHQLSENSRFVWNWRRWGDGDFYPFHDKPEKARERIAELRENGRDLMATTSLTHFGRFRFYANAFGPVDHPGLEHRELLLWEPWWRRTTMSEVRMPVIPEEQTAEGDWYGKRYQPRGFINLCPNSPFQDYYLWRLEQEVKSTGLSSINLLQPSSARCANGLHDCGYINYQGDWAPGLPIFAMREMVMRMRQILHDSGHEPYIRWHSGDAVLGPVLSFVDVFLGGEGYTHGSLKVLEFYSDSLTPERMRVHHTGLPFGFAHTILPKFETKYAPTEASVLDMAGLFFVHNSSLLGRATRSHSMAGYLAAKRFAFNLDGKETQYYWDGEGPVNVSGGDVKFILHYDSESALLILFNPEEVVAEAEVRFSGSGDLSAKALSGMKDVINGEQLSPENGLYQVPLKPKGMRMFVIGE